MSDLVPMKLSVRGRRIRHKKRKLEIIKTYKTHEVKSVECSVVHNGRASILLLDVETPSSHIRFNLKTTTVVKLVGNFSHGEYPYQIRWKMGKLRYKLRVNQLSLCSTLIALNRQFCIRHII